MTAPRSINFVAPRMAWLFGHAPRAASRWVQGALLLLAAAALAAALVQWRSAHTARGELPPPSPMVPPVAAAPLPGAADRTRINRVVRRLNTPWQSIFEALDKQAHPKVALLSLETDADRGAVRVTTEGPSLDELLQHAERAQATPPFERSKLLRIEQPDAAGALPGITRLSFDLSIR